MKKIVPLILLLIISFQCLPVKELCKSIFDISIVDDAINENEEIEKEKKFEKEFALVSYEYEVNIFTIKKQNHFPINATGIQPYPIVDVTTPPPNA